MVDTQNRDVAGTPQQVEKPGRGPVKDHIAELPKYQPGLPETVVRERYRLNHIARLASNENPFGMSRPAMEAGESVLKELYKYSDPDSAQLRSALSKASGVAADRIVIGNGSEDLICVICRACLGKNDRVITVHPSFPLHEIYPLEQEAKVILVPMTPDLRFDVPGIIREVEKGCRMLIFSNPSNPVGAMLTGDELLRICDAVSPETLIVIDEAYYEYVSGTAAFPDTLAILSNRPNPYIILRTFSKAYALAGSRVGFGLFSDSWFADQINKLRTPFNINLVAQAAALAALKDVAHLEKSVGYNTKECARVIRTLRTQGYTVADSWANFIFVDTGKESKSVAEKLLAHGIIVKPWTARGYETFLRATIGMQEDNDRFIQILGRCIA